MDIAVLPVGRGGFPIVAKNDHGGRGTDETPVLTIFLFVTEVSQINPTQVVSHRLPVRKWRFVRAQKRPSICSTF